MNVIFLPQSYFFNPYAIAHIIVAQLMLFLGSFVLLQNKKSTTNISYFLICFGAWWWLLFDAIIMSSKNESIAFFWAKAVYIGITLIPTSMYFFSVAWLGQFKNRKKGVICSYIAGVCFVVLLYFTDKLVVGVYRYFFGFFSKLGYFSVFYLVFFFGVSSLFFWNLIQSFQKETLPFRKTQIKQVLIAFILCFTIGVTEYLPTFGIETFPLGFIAVFILVSVIAHAIIRYKLWEIETVIHKTIGWVVTDTALIIPWLVMLFFTKEWYVKLPPLGAWSYLSVLLLGFLAFAKSFYPHVDRFFQKERFDLESVLERFSEELVHLRGVEELVNKITDLLMDTIYPGKIVVLLYQDRVKKLVTMEGVRDSLKIQLQLDTQTPFLKWLAHHDRIVNYDYIQVDPRLESIYPEAEKYFHQMETVLCLPLVLNQRLIGLINLGRKVNLKPYRTLDYQFLTRLKNHVTIALSNSLVYDRVEELVKIKTEELVQTQKQLIQAEKLATVGTLAGGVAHEINNPLTAVLTNTQMLLMMAENEEEKESLKLIEEATKRCREIVKKLMVYARKPLGGREIAEVDLEKVINNIVSLLDHHLTQETIRVNVSVENRPVLVKGCQNELEQVLTNLILNSRDAIKNIKKEGEIRISIKQDDAKAILEVTDDGIGIAPEHLSRIFDPFFTTKDVGKGTGLGLSICQSIIEQHGGTISVRSKVNQGTIFTIEFPKSRLRFSQKDST